MRLRSLVVALVTIGSATFALPGSVGVATSPAPSTPPSSAVIAKQMGAMPLPFTKNEGQWDERVLFRTRAGGATVWFCRDGITYQFTHRVSKEGTDPDDPKSGFRHPRLMGMDDLSTTKDSIETVVVHAKFVSANPNAAVFGDNLLDYKCNYFIGNDPLQWRTDVPNYAGIVYREVYPGIDVHFEGRGSSVESRYEAKPGVDLSKIQIRYEGNASVVETDSGVALIEAPWGTLIQSSLVRGGVSSSVRQRTEYASGPLSTSGARIAVSGIVLEYSTYLGGSIEDHGKAVAVGTDGSVYLTGYTHSPGSFFTDFPIQNPYDGSYNGNLDVFVSKLSPAGDQLMYSTFLGGMHGEIGWGIDVDENGSVCITGETWSPNFPTQNAYDGSFNGGAPDGSGAFDVFAAKFNAAGNGLIYCTYIGGAGGDVGRGVALDGDGSAYITGFTAAPNFPTLNAFDASHNGDWDAFVAKLSSTGITLEYSTFLGGSVGDEGWGIAVDANGSAYVTGGTQSSDFPTQNPYDGSHNGGADAFVTKLSPAGDALVYSTFLGGGSDWDLGDGIAVDVGGSTYVTGRTFSSDFPTQNPYDGSHNGGADAFVTKLTPAGNELVYSTFLGGSAGDYGNGIAVDVDGSAYVTGTTASSDFPMEVPYDGSWNGGYDVFVVKLSPAGSALGYSTFLGGSSNDDCFDIALDTFGSAYVVGLTYSADFPAVGAYDASYNGSGDIFIAKLAAPPCECSCHADPMCDGATDIVDVVAVINVAFRDGVVVTDPYCHRENTDVNCSGSTDVLDVVSTVNVALRGTSAASEFCNPCP